MSVTTVRFGDFVVKELDQRNWTLERLTDRPKKDKNGVPTGENIVEFIGYYAGVPGAAISALNQHLRGQGATDAKALIARINEFEERVRAAERTTE